MRGSFLIFMTSLLLSNWYHIFYEFLSKDVQVLYRLFPCSDELLSG
jgi:hypothetical protein